MTRQFLIAEICKHIRSIQGQELGACVDVTVPWGEHCQISVRVERMTGKCINLCTDIEMLTIDPKILDAAFAGRMLDNRSNEQPPMGANA